MCWSFVSVLFHVVAVHWYVVCGIVAAGCVFLLGLSVCAYQCVRRRSRSRSADDARENQLSSAIRKGLIKDYHHGGGAGGVVKSPSMCSTGSTHGGTSAGAGGGGKTGADNGRNVTGTGQPSPAAGGPGGSVTCSRKSPTAGSQIIHTQCYVVNEKEGSRSPIDEKVETTKEKEVEDDEAEDEKMSSTGLGCLQFAVSYDKEKTALVVTVTRARRLPVKDPNVGSSDPYVKLQLLPDKRQKVCKVQFFL